MDKKKDTTIQLEDVDQNGTPSRRKLSTQETRTYSRGSTVTFHNICYVVKTSSGMPCKKKVTKKDILRDVNGIMRPGLNAILGPTGSGKSSLLDILAARKNPKGLSGDVLIDGAPQPPNFKCISGYVVQDDVVMGTLTVKENFQFSAALRLPKSIRQKQKNEKVEQLIRELGLSKVANSKIGTAFVRGVSGGERKRTNIGMELITDPSVLFLDEPTTGLDASTAGAVLLLLKRLSRKGRTIIFSIHQPRFSIFRLFDSLTLLASGRMVYHGPAQDAVEYFASIGYTCEAFNNPADFFLDVVNGDSTAVASNKEEDIDIDMLEHGEDDRSIVERLAEEYSKSSYYRDTKTELEKLSEKSSEKSAAVFRSVTYATSFCHQLKWVSKRTFKNLLGTPQASVAQLGISVFLGLIVGALFFGVKNDDSGIQNRVGALFFMSTNQCFSSASAIELFITENKIFIHEYISGYYSVSAYFFSKLMADLLPMRTLPSIILSSIAYFMIGFKPTVEAFFTLMLTLILTSYTATSMTLAISAGQNVVAVASLLTTISFVFMLIFSGLLVNLPSIMDWLSWLQYLSIPQYALTALQVNELTGLKFNCDPSDTTSSPNNSSSSARCFTGEEYLARQGIEASSWGLWQNHLALAIMTIIFLLITYLKLRFMNKFT
ncbi:broad substrate specificity ATP-binding cassette transporter ABCG2 [Protopterus annectens]|uniref:broad substrate specificity ATP-binding cassette transporter ABCG2 n=1 Tax=Protopterus annectens TaxID=7888 RepID=UPI001CFBBFEB|nr:broad substrate specificity ATP-binding cassette transporter ABCG2 [Protopterus annectens]XP_043917294.1 broad substrate specificity ATP-binding cassette transporter ABCG2 [Protopterus annectens]